MVDDLRGTDSLPGIVGENLVQEVIDLLPLGRVWDLQMDFLQKRLGPLELGELREQLLHLRVFCNEEGLKIFIDSPQSLQNFEELMSLRVSHEDGLEQYQLGQNAASRPNVYFSPVFSIAKKEFDGTIEPGNDVGTVELLGLADEFGGAEVADFEVVVEVEENVLWFQVSVDDALFVDIFEAFENLEADPFDFLPGELLARLSLLLDQRIEIEGVVLEHYVLHQTARVSNVEALQHLDAMGKALQVHQHLHFP